MRRVKLASLLFSRNYSSNQITTISVKNSVKYPEILDPSPAAVKARQRRRKAENIEALNTVEEKLFAVNIEKYYGWNSIILNEGVYPFNFLPFVNYVTRTYVSEVEKDSFHKIQNVNINEHKELLGRIRPYLQEAILFELLGKNSKKETGFREKSNSEISNETSNSVLLRINEILLSSLTTQYPHLIDSMVDYDPRVEAFWLVGNFHPSDSVYKEREEKEGITEEEKKEKVEHWIQYFGKPSLQLRSVHPLPVLNTDHIIEYNDSNKTNIIPVVNSDPSLAYGLNFSRRHGTNIPGFWPGDKFEFGVLSYHNQGHLIDRPPHFGEKEHKETLHSQAVLAGFGLTHSLACYQGFSTYSDVTYPFVTQHVVSDGRNFSFYLYQLNTTLLNADNPLKNPRLNLCISLPQCQLYKEIKGGEFVGWDDSVLSTLISCYLNKPQEREQVDLKPFINPGEKLVAQIKDDEKRKWLHDQFRHVYSNRPRHRLPYEIYDWERIYKIKHKTRSFEAKTRPFEHDENPLEDRKHYEQSHPYIPKKFRSKKKHWTGWRAKMAKTYYPDV